MRRILLSFLALFLCSLGHSQNAYTPEISSYQYTMKLGPANNQVSLYLKPMETGVAIWGMVQFVVGFPASAVPPSVGTWANSLWVDTVFGAPYTAPIVKTGGTSISPAGFNYTEYTIVQGVTATRHTLIKDQEYLIGTITYSNLPGVSDDGTTHPFTPYLLDFLDAGSTGTANVFVNESGIDYTPQNGNANFYAAPSGGYQNSGSQLVDIGAGNSALRSTVTLLPLKLLSFTATKQSGKTNTALLSWTAAEQVNTGSFEIERSTDGRSYSKIGAVAAAGNYAGERTYTFTDANAQNGTNYYRLKMVDIDGSFSYAKWIRTVTFDVKAIGLQLTPNPTQNVCYIKGLTQPAVVKLLDMNGRVLLVQNGVTSTSPINVTSLAPAVYLVQVIQNGQVLNTLKLIKE